MAVRAGAQKVGRDADLKLRDDRLVFAALLLATLVCTFLPLPFRLAGMLSGMWGVLLGVRLLARLARRARTGRSARGHLGIAVGLGALAVMLLELGTEAAFLPAYQDRQDCLDGANTVAEQHACEQAFTQRLSSRR